MRAGVPVVYADEKVNHELGAEFHVQLGDDVLQPPLFAWRKETAGAIERRRLLVVLAQDEKRMLYRIWPPSRPQQWASHTHLVAWRATEPLLSSRFHLKYIYIYNNYHINSPNGELKLKGDRSFCTFLCNSLLIWNVNFFPFNNKCKHLDAKADLSDTSEVHILSDEKSLAWTQLRPTYGHRCRICTGSWPWWGQRLPLPLFSQGLLQTEPGGTARDGGRRQKDKEDK